MSDFLRAFIRFDPSAMRRAMLLNFAVAFTEGMGLLMLLPLLMLAGVLGTNDAQTSGKLTQILSEFGISLNLEFALLIFVVLIFLQAQLMQLKDRVAFSLQLRFGDYLRTTLYAAISRAHWRFLTGCHSGELTNALTSEVQRISSGTNYLFRFFTVAVLLCVYLAVALWLSAGLTLLALATGAVLWFLLRSTDRVAKQSGLMVSDANRRLSKQTQEFLSALKLIKIHGEEADTARRFDGEVAGVSRHFIEFRRAFNRTQTAYRVGGAMALAVVSYAALVWFVLPAANLLVLVAIFARMLPQLAELQNGKQQLLHMLPAYAAWRKLLDACEANRDPQLSHPAPVLLNQGVAFGRVSFRYPQSHHELYIESLLIPAKKTTAISGISGAGKSTLLDLLSGLLMPDSGTILVDGVPLAELPGWRKSIAYIPQETLIMNGSLRDNLAWGNAAPDEKEIERALRQSALLELVQRLPHGLETEVGERGIKLSGGERQRLALARALLRHPQLLILDEATSALDAGNHRLVLDAIRALHGSMTVVIVTHRHEELAGLIDGVVCVTQGVVEDWQAVDS